MLLVRTVEAGIIRPSTREVEAFASGVGLVNVGISTLL
jgi:hypothetical protein